MPQEGIVPAVKSNTTLLRGAKIIKMAVGEHSSALLTQNGTVFLAGHQFHISHHHEEVFVPAEQENVNFYGEKILDIGGGHDFFIAMSASGKVYTWGANQVYQIYTLTSIVWTIGRQFSIPS